MKFFKAAVLLILCVCAASAQTPAPQAALKGAPPQPKLAQPFSITYSAPVPAGVKAQDLIYDKDALNAEDFTVTGTEAATVGNSIEFTFHALPFALGKTKFTAAWKLPDGSVIKAQDTELDIARVNTGIRGSDIVDIREPVTPVDWWRIILYLTIAGVIAVPLVWWFIVRKRVSAPEFPNLPPPDNRPADVAAKDRLSKLLASGLWEKQDYKLFYIELTEIFRTYIYARFNIHADPQTTAELLRAIKNSAAKAVLPEAKQFLNAADLVKFAEVVPLALDRDEDIKLLTGIIDSTAVKPAAEEDKNGNGHNA